MKKFIILFVYLISSSLLCAGNLYDIGMKIGYTSSSFSGKELPGKGVSNVPGFILGGFARYGFSEKISLQSEILLGTKGSKINTVGDIEQYNVFVYIEMPILLKYKILGRNGFMINGLFGSSVNVKALAINDIGVLENIRDFDAGLIAGAEVQSGRFSFELRYEQGLINFDTSGDSVLKNRSISFVVGITFVHIGGES